MGRFTRRNIFGLFATAPIAGRAVIKEAWANRLPPKLRRVTHIDMIRDKNVLLSLTDYTGNPIVNLRDEAIKVIDEL